MSQISPSQTQIDASVGLKRTFLEQTASGLYSLWKFSRPHTIIGTSFSAIALYLIAGFSSTPDWHSVLSHSWLQFLGTWLACLCGNVYIVGLNQLEDIEIDQINKPHLPLAAGEYSPTMAKWIIGVTGVAAVALAGGLGPWLLGMVSVSLAIGTAYSLPPIRLKRFPFWASLCIFTVRGVVVNLGLFLHFSWVKSRFAVSVYPEIPATVWALTLFIIGFTFAIAILKDLPDIEGDRRYNITTFTLTLGSSAVFNLGCWVISGCYLGLLAAALFGLDGINGRLSAIAHLVTLTLLWWRSQSVNLQSQAEIASFYQFVWKLFFLEYLIFPLVCLL
ncbi:MAG: homogentisate phytyltransferase [Desertifilum sp.]|nr:homogentisate phytyltransferase [Desertifilum sp.]